MREARVVLGNGVVIEGVGGVGAVRANDTVVRGRGVRSLGLGGWGLRFWGLRGEGFRNKG